MLLTVHALHSSGLYGSLTKASSHTVTSHGGAQIVPPVTPQAYASHGTIGKARELAQSSLYAPSFH